MVILLHNLILNSVFGNSLGNIYGQISVYMYFNGLAMRLIKTNIYHRIY